jgi:hypothetical protein
MYYEIYDSETRNLLVDTETLAEALAVVRATVGKHGPEAVANWMLVEDNDTNAGGGRPIATGNALAQLATKPRTTLAPSHD